MLRHREEREAIVFWNEAGRQRSLTFAALYEAVARLAVQALREAGVSVGDRVAGFMPNMPETIIAMLATASLGAIWSSTSPDFGVAGVLDRFTQIEPKILFTADGYFYNGKTFDCLARAAELAERIPSIERVVVVPYVAERPACHTVRNALLWDEFLAQFAAPRDPAEPIPFAQLPFDHPLYILYSSGTTGPPKCIVHSAGGTLVQHLKELILHTDLKRTDRIMYFSTCGWMMWNWMVSSLAVGATVVIYDGSPFQPDGHALFKLIEQERLTIFGTSAKYLSAVEKAGIEPGRSHDLSSLRTVLSTGSPLAAESFDFVYRSISSDICLSSISGGTDIISCFALGNPIGPVYRGELQIRGLGMKVEIFNDRGEPVRGEVGELVCTAPFPSLPIGFLNDPDGAKYRQAYFSVYPNVWRHGDYAELTEHDGLIIYGRSDAVLNPGGVRIGTGEIYRQVEQQPEVLESVAVGQEWQGDERIVLFVKLRPGLGLVAGLARAIAARIRRNTTPRHVPAKIVQVADIPRTTSGKIVELAVRDVIHGRAVKNREALANPEALKLFENLSELNAP